MCILVHGGAWWCRIVSNASSQETEIILLKAKKIDGRTAELGFNSKCTNNGRTVRSLLRTSNDLI